MPIPQPAQNLSQNERQVKYSDTSKNDSNNKDNLSGILNLDIFSFSVFQSNK